MFAQLGGKMDPLYRGFQLIFRSQVVAMDSNGGEGAFLHLISARIHVFSARWIDESLWLWSLASIFTFEL